MESQSEEAAKVAAEAASPAAAAAATAASLGIHPGVLTCDPRVPDSINLINDRLAKTRPDESVTPDITVALEELQASYEELRAAEEELLTQNQVMVEMQSVLEEERFIYQELFELAPDGYIVTDANGTIREANLAAQQMLHIPARFIVGKPLISFIAPEDRQIFRACLSRVSRESRHSWEALVQPCEGAALPVNITVTASVASSNGRISLRWLLRDITERRAAEASLFEATQLLQALVQASPVAIAVLNSANQVTLWNPAAERILGWRAEEVMGRVPPGVPLEVRASFDRAGRTLAGIGREGLETRITCKDGHPLDVEVWTAPIRDSEGRSTSTVAIAVDISERTQATQTQRQLLERVVAVQEEERARLSREMHDHMGQHLTAIMLGLKALQSESEASPCGERRDASRRTTELLGMVDELMQTTHRLAWELRPPELDDIGLEAALQRYTTHWSQHSGITVDFQSNGYARQCLPASAETTLYRVAQEALTNVARHSKASHASVILKCDKVEGSVIIDDDGVGFGARAAARAKSRLGVAGMRERMALVGGTLEIESEPGHGTTVFARVPHTADATPPGVETK